MTSKLQKCQGSIQLKTYQLAIAQWLLRHPDQKGIIVEYGTGTGKTLAAVNFAALLMEVGVVTDVVVVCPKAVIPGFTKEIVKCTGFPAKKKLPPSYNVYSYETFRKNHANKVTKNTLLVVDEAHNLRNAGTARSQAITKAARKAKKILLLTATPFINEPSDISWAARLIHPKGDKYFPVTREAFDKLYKDAPAKYVKHLKNLIAVYHDDHQTSTKPKITFHKKVVNLDKKVAKAIEKIRHQHKFSMDQIDKIMKQLRQHSDEGGPKDKNWSRVNAFLGKVRQASNGIESSKPCSSKVEQLVKTAMKGPKPALIYSQFKKHGIQLVADCLKKKKVSASKIGIFTGSLSLSQRKKLIEKYDDKNLDYLLITRAASEGVDLKGTRQIHVLEPYWNPSAMEQIFGRGVRLTSHTHLPKNQQHVDLYMWLGKIDANHLKRQGVSSKDAKELAAFSPDLRLFDIAEKKKQEIQKYEKLNLKASISTDIQHSTSKRHDSIMKTKSSRKSQTSRRSKKPQKPRTSKRSKRSKKSHKPRTSKNSKDSRCRNQMPPCPEGCNRVKRFKYKTKTGKEFTRQAHCRK